MHNKLKEKLQAGDVVFGAFVGLGHPDVTEMLSRIGFDWLLLDAEHGPLSFETMQSMMQAMNGTDCVPIVRPQWNDLVQIKRVLDIGAYGVLVPWVNSKEDAENAVRACRYPPQGIRGYGPRRAGWFDKDYFETANKEVLVAIQIETKQAVENIEDILSVSGIDACYVGPYDLSCNFGLGVPPKWDNSEYFEALCIILEAAGKYRKPAGIFATVETIEWAVAKGFRLNTVGSADSFLVQSARTALAKAVNSTKQKLP